MKAKFKIFLLSVALLLVVQPVLVAADVSSDSIDYLKTAGQTSWVTMALVAADATGIATDHLKTSDNAPLEYAKTILAVTASGQNPEIFGNVNYINELKSYYQNSQIGNEEMLMDDSFGILALASAGLADDSAEISGTKDYLISKQNSDGGWGYNVGVASDTNSTAIITISLIEAGVSASDEVITKALNYLQTMQNSDGGFGWSAGNESDTDSSAWVVWAIRKAGLNPLQWQKENNNPIIFLASMKNPDGSFGRMASNHDANLMATQDAVIALSGKVLPLGYFQPANDDNGNNTPSPVGQYHLRIEGLNGSICDKSLSGTTAYDLLVAGSSACNYTFTGNRDWGTFFLDSINDVSNNFPAYWMYLVNNVTTDDGLEQYNLQSGDEVLIYYDSDTNTPAYPDYDRPLRLSVNDDKPDPNENITVTVEYYNNGWQAAANATVLGADQNYQTNESGQVTLALPAGYYTLSAEKPNFIRSNQVVIACGNGVSQGVGLKVEIDQGGRGQIAGEAIIFEVNPSQLDFGKIKPGTAASQAVSLNNGGTVNLVITAAVSGDLLFINNLQIGGSNWSGYSSVLTSQNSRQEEVKLSIPANYIGLGIKTGELIFWAQAQ